MKMLGEDIRQRETDYLLTVGEVAMMLYVHPNTVRRWSNLGKLPCFRPGLRGDRRYRRKEVLAFAQVEIQKLGIM